MQTFEEALDDGFEQDEYGNYTFNFGDGYELIFEPCLFDRQYYVALYKDKLLLTSKVVVKPGKEESE